MGTATALVVALAGLALPTAASANFEVEIDNGTLKVTHGVIMGITYDGSQYHIGDASASATVTSPCFVDPNTVDAAYCPGGLVARVDATATLAIQLDDGGGPEPVLVPSHLTLLDIQTQGYGGNGDDVIVSENPASGDDFRGGPGNDTLLAGPSNGNFSQDQLLGGEGNDILDPGTGPDTVVGGNGTDTLNYTGRTDPLKVTLPQTGTSIGNGGSADGPGSRDQISEVENVTGGSGADSLTGNSLDNTLAGAGGNDVLDGGTGPDTLDGGSGTDTVDYSARTEPVSATLAVGSFHSAGNGSAADGPAPRDRIAAVENLTGGSGPSTLTGNTLPNVLTGGIGADHLAGGGGGDRLTGGEGADILLGQGGIDRLFAKDGQRDRSINCGPGGNRRESAKRDRKDPPAKSC